MRAVAAMGDAGGAADPHNLRRFIEAQEGVYGQALAEIRGGHKRSHWMWFMFPQVEGLGFSETSQRYAIKSLAEAEAYLRNPILGPRLVECCEAVLAVDGQSAVTIFGPVDAMKLRSCATLFSLAAPVGSVFDRVLAKYFEGKRDGMTLRILGVAAGAD